MGFFISILFIIMIFVGGYQAGLDDKDALAKHFVERFREHPFCMSQSATVLDKTTTVKRCWKAVEVSP